MKYTLTRIVNAYSKFILNISYIIVREFVDTVFFIPCTTLIALSAILALLLSLGNVIFASLIFILIMIVNDTIVNIMSIVGSISLFTRMSLNTVFIASQSICLIGISLYLLNKYVVIQGSVIILPLILLSLMVVNDSVKSSVASRAPDVGKHPIVMLVSRNTFFLILTIASILEVLNIPFAMPCLLLIYIILTFTSTLYMLIKCRYI